MPLGPESLRVAIAGATSLRGKDLAQYIEESSFPAGEIRLFDEELAEGLLTEVGGEPAVVRAITESSFERIRFVFFTGSPAFAAKHAPAALRAGATLIDLCGGLRELEGARPWIPGLDSLLSPPPVESPGQGRIEVCLSPSVPAMIAGGLSASLAGCGLKRLAIVFFLPVSERGPAGISELEKQMVDLLSLHAIPQDVFDTQVAFNLLDRWGPESREKLSDTRDRVSKEVGQYLAGRAPVPALTIIQAPVFFGQTFSAYVEFAVTPSDDEIVRRLQAGGFAIVPESDPGPSNLSVVGEAQANIRLSHPDANCDRGLWLWGAADNFRMGSVNAIRIAERLLAS
jgi:aspartate-semialdehyde dehydrogenase